MMSLPNHFVHSGNPQSASIFGSKPIRVRFPLASNLVSFLAVARSDLGEIGPEEGQRVASWVLSDVPLGRVWIKPGVRSQHFYLGHEEFLARDG